MAGRRIAYIRQVMPARQIADVSEDYSADADGSVRWRTKTRRQDARSWAATTALVLAGAESLPEDARIHWPAEEAVVVIAVCFAVSIAFEFTALASSRQIFFREMAFFCNR